MSDPQLESEVIETVSKKAYQDVTSDMHKFKNQAKELAEKLNQIEIEKKLAEEAKLVEQQKFKELFEKKDSELKQFTESLTKKEQELVEQRKKNEILKEIKFKKPEYEKFLDLNNIKITDGTLDSESVKKEIARIQQNFSELIEEKSIPQPLPNNSSKSIDFNTQKPLDKMSQDELWKLYFNKKRNK